MKYKNIAIFLIILGFFVANIFLLYSISEKEKYLNQASEKILSLQERINQTNRKSNVQCNFNNTLINDSLFINHNEWNEYKNKHLHKNKLFLFYSEIHCNVCVDIEILNLKELSEKIGNDKIIIITDSNSDKDISLFKKLHQIDFKIFSINTTFLPVEIQHLKAPLYFLMNKSQKTKFSFVPVFKPPKSSD